ncbi:MAG: hypothetical protein U1C97_00990, partial [Candidatus Gracilibacteria bacterium]|nr:hypothetical protein [Candidatus Gracilibacteria bacterium]
MSVSSRQQTSQWVLGGIIFFLGLLLLGFHLWLSFFVMAELNQQVQAEDLALQSLKTQQNGFLQPEIRNLFAQYSDGISAVESVFAAREEVFTGEMTEKKFEPVTILDVLDFFKNLQDHLGQQTIMEELSLDPSGRLSLLVRTTSYR